MAEHHPKLTDGAINKILSNEKVVRPVLQIVLYKQMSSQNRDNSQTKYRFQLTDGIENCSNFIVVLPELIQRISRGEFEKFTVIQLNGYSLSSQPQMDRQIIIITDMSVLMAGSKIGKRLDKTEPTVGLLSNVNLNTTSNVNISIRTEVSKSYNNLSSTSTSNRPMGASAPVPDRANVCPITAITPYYNAWRIRARVTSKANKRSWSNAKGEGTVFSFEVTDSSGEIRINCFTKECEKYYDLIELNKVYYISRGTVKTANKRFSNLTNDYEITLNSDSVVEECFETDGEAMPKIRFKLIPIKDLANVSLQSMVDVIAIVKSIDDLMSITSKKTNKELKKRDVYLFDNTSYEVRLTLWNEMAQQFDCAVNSVIALKGVSVGDFNGRTLSAGGSTTIHIEPDIPETNILKNWFAREGQSVTTNPLSRSGGEGNRDNEWRFCSQINEQSVNADNRTYFNLRARVVSTGRNPLYKACGQNGCLKKVMDNNNGFYHCDKCQTDSPNFQWRLILSLAVSDCTGDMWVTVFQETAEKMLGITAQELSELQDNDPQQFQKALSAAEFKPFVLRVGSRLEHYMDETRVKSVAFNQTPIDPIKHSKQLINNLKQWNP